MPRILLVEDDRSISDLVRLHLVDNGHEVTQVWDGRDAMRIGQENTHDLIILDLTLPGVDGIDICRRLRKDGVNCPLLMLTSRAEESDKVLGLESGADDYLTKPFSVRELIARVKVLLRRQERSRPGPQVQQLIERHGLRIDVHKRAVEVHGGRVDLTPLEFDLLVHLASHPGVTFTREELLSSVWGYEFSGYEHTVNSHINRLRNKIERQLAAPEFVLTTWGVGYRFNDR